MGAQNHRARLRWSVALALFAGACYDPPSEVRPGELEPTGDTDDTTGSSDTDPGDSTGEPDPGEAGTGGAMGPGEPSDAFVLTIDDGIAETWLVRVAVDGAASEPICRLAPGTQYDALAFTRAGALIAHNVAGRLEQIDPCSCAFTVVLESAAVGISADEADDLLAIDPVANTLVQIDVDGRQQVDVGLLGPDLSTAAMVWSDELAAPVAVAAATDLIYRIDPVVAAATEHVMVAMDLLAVGLATQPGTGDTYLCGGTDMLYRLDLTTGATEEVGAMGLTSGACDALAAPTIALDCLP